MPILLLLVLLSFTYQISEYQTYNTPDKSFSFQYPQDWVLDITPNVSSVDVGKFDIPLDAVHLEMTLPFNLYESQMLNLGEDIETIVEKRTALWQEFIASAIRFETEISQIEIGTAHPYSYAYTIGKYTDNFGNTTSTTFLSVKLDDKVTIFVLTSKHSEDEEVSHIEALMSIVESITYKPENQQSGNSQLPNVFSKEVGVLQRGELTFFYPQDWYVTVAGAVLLQNTSDYLNPLQLTEGQIQVGITSPEQNAALAFSQEEVASCEKDPELVNAVSLISAIVMNINTNSPNMRLSQDLASITLDGRTVYYVMMEDQTVEIIYVASDFDNSDVVSLMAMSPKGGISEHKEMLLEIAASIQYTSITCEKEET